LRARHAAGEIMCADEDRRFVPTAVAGGVFPGYLTANAIMIERGIDDRQFAELLASGSMAYGDWDEESQRLCGVPNQLANGLNYLFSTLPPQDRPDFVVEAVNAIPVGADLSSVCNKWFLDLLVDPDHGVLRHTETDKARAATEAVAVALRRQLAGDDPAAAEWSTLADEAYTVGAYAAYFAAKGGLGEASNQAVRIAVRIAAAGVEESDPPPDASGAAEAIAQAEVAARRWHASRLVHHIAAA
jgi:hypothetical protein